MTEKSYTLIRSSRRTLALQIGKGGELIARAPRLLPVFLIERFISAKHSWIEKHQSKIVNQKPGTERKIYSETEIGIRKKALKKYLDIRVRDLWEGKNLPKYTSLKVTKSEHRWGSCSGKNSLCFSYRLAEYLPLGYVIPAKVGVQASKSMDPETSSGGPAFIDAIIYHELAHLREKNHGKGFWSLVYSMIPEYEDIMRAHRHGDIV